MGEVLTVHTAEIDTPVLEQARGLLYALTPTGVRRTEDDDGCIYVLPLSAPLDPRLPLPATFGDAGTQPMRSSVHRRTTCAGAWTRSL